MNLTYVIIGNNNLLFLLFSLYKCNTIYTSTVNRHLGNFQFIAIKNKDTMNMLVHVRLGTRLSFILGIYLKYNH